MPAVVYLFLRTYVKLFPHAAVGQALSATGSQLVSPATPDPKKHHPRLRRSHQSTVGALVTPGGRTGIRESTTSLACGALVNRRGRAGILA